MIEIRELTGAERARMAATHRTTIDALPPREDIGEETARMAEAMIDITAAQGNCTPADLIEAGFTPDDIAKNAAAALFEATRKSERREP